MFFRNDMILICLSVCLVQRYDSKRVAICAREVEPTAQGGADTGEVARSGAASVARWTEHSEEWLRHLPGTRSLCAEMAGGQISNMFYFKPGVKLNRCRLVPRTGTRDKKAALHRCSLSLRVKPDRCRPEGRRYITHE